MKTNYQAMTCKRAAMMGFTPVRPYGYTVLITPPIEHVSVGADIEGIGFWQWPQPRKTVQNFLGWYKHKSDAVKRAKEFNATS